MRDLTTGSVTSHLLRTTSFMLVSMVFQTLYVLVDPYWVGRLGTDAVAAVAISGNLMFLVLGLAVEYLGWMVPAMALQFAMVAMGSALRGTGNFKPGMIVQTMSVILNIILAPVLIFGWGTGQPMGVAGAALASPIAIAVGVVYSVIRPFGAPAQAGFGIGSCSPGSRRSWRWGLPWHRSRVRTSARAIHSASGIRSRRPPASPPWA